MKGCALEAVPFSCEGPHSAEGYAPGPTDCRAYEQKRKERCAGRGIRQGSGVGGAIGAAASRSS